MACSWGTWWSSGLGHLFMRATQSVLKCLKQDNNVRHGHVRYECYHPIWPTVACHLVLKTIFRRARARFKVISHVNTIQYRLGRMTIQDNAVVQYHAWRSPPQDGCGGEPKTHCARACVSNIYSFDLSCLFIFSDKFGIRLFQLDTNCFSILIYCLINDF